jgi:hypothetical protein
MVGPSFLDDIHDTRHRQHVSYGSEWYIPIIYEDQRKQPLPKHHWRWPGCWPFRHLAAEENQAPRPNIIHIMVDDLGWRDLSQFIIYGSETFHTPHIDAKHFIPPWLPGASVTPMPMLPVRFVHPHGHPH